jgi:hypothetical protein
MVAPVRWFLLVICFVALSRSLHGQQQNRKLIDRLLEPDLSLMNPAQDKEFSGTRPALAEKQFAPKTFNTGEQKSAKTFVAKKHFPAKSVATKEFPVTEASANLRANVELVDASRYQLKQSNLVRLSSEAEKSVRLREYPDTRPFLAKGTRQEILSQQDRPLTIDEVRELLNKNK